MNLENILPQYSPMNTLQVAGLDRKVVTEPILYGKTLKQSSRRLAYIPELGDLELGIFPHDWVHYPSERFLNDFLMFCHISGFKPTHLGALVRENHATGVFTAVAIAKADIREIGLRNIRHAGGRSQDGIQPTVILTAPWEYGQGIKFRLNTVRLACQNGMITTQKSGGTVVKHTEQGFAALRNQFNQTAIESIRQFLVLQQFARTQISDIEAMRLIKEIVGEGSALYDKSRCIERVTDIYHGEMDDEATERGIQLNQVELNGSVYGIYQAIAAYWQHFQPVSSSETNRAYTSLLGERLTHQNRCYNSLARAYAMDWVRASNRQVTQAVPVGVALG